MNRSPARPQLSLWPPPPRSSRGPQTSRGADLPGRVRTGARWGPGRDPPRPDAASRLPDRTHRALSVRSAAGCWAESLLRPASRAAPGRGGAGQGRGGGHRDCPAPLGTRPEPRPEPRHTAEGEPRLRTNLTATSHKPKAQEGGNTVSMPRWSTNPIRDFLHLFQPNPENCGDHPGGDRFGEVILSPVQTWGGHQRMGTQTRSPNARMKRQPSVNLIEGTLPISSHFPAH